MVSSQFPPENGHSQIVSVTLTDDAGRAISCHVEQWLEVDGQQYALLSPEDVPIEIFTWQTDKEEETAILLEDDAEIDLIFSTAEAVLQELNLTLKRTALTLTVTGELPPIVEDEILTLDLEDETFDLESEQFQLLANFFHQDQEYAIYTPLDPLMFFARLSATGETELLSPEEFQKMQPLLEAQFLEQLEQ